MQDLFNQAAHPAARNSETSPVPARPRLVQLPYAGAFRPPHERDATQQRLPFTVDVVRSDLDMADAFQLAQNAYGRHVPEMVYDSAIPGLADLEPGYVVLIARSKFDGTAVGTMKIQVNTHERLNLERSVTLPDWLEGCSQAGANRLGVSAGAAGRMVKLALFKAYFLYCVENEIDWMVIAARKPLDRTYQDLQFKDVFGPGEFVPLAHAANIPHRVMAFEVATAEQRWRAAHHPLYDFIFATRHPDIAVVQHQLSLPVTRQEEQHLSAAA